jgi:hypothetical protein
MRVTTWQILSGVGGIEPYAMQRNPLAANRRYLFEIRMLFGPNNGQAAPQVLLVPFSK